MSADPDTPRWRILREGYLDVKSPPDSPERILHKAWRRLWVCAAVYCPSGRGEPHLILQFSRKEDDEPEKRLKASRDGLRLFRCKSGSRALRTWALSSGSSLLIYLADETEEDTQKWMETVREGLWPSIRGSRTGGSHEVSLIDDEKSFASGLLGVYGRLVKTSENAICVIHPHWQGTQMRWGKEDILDVRLVRKTGNNEDSETGVFNLSVKSTKKDGRILQFYSKTASTTVDWIKSILDPQNDEQRVDTEKAISTSHCETDIDVTKSCLVPTAEYAVVNKSKTPELVEKEDSKPNASNNLYGKLQSKDDLHIPNIPGHILDARMSLPSLKYTGDASTSEDKPPATTSDSGNHAWNDLYGKVQSKGDLQLPNIPGHFLDASMSSPSLKRSGDASTSEDKPPVSAGDSGDNSPGELYDHIYEEMNSLKYSRSETVYEEIDDTDGDYVPPMPPTLPARQNPAVANALPKAVDVLPSSKAVAATPDAATLRLQKLSQSLSDALKLVEEKSQPKDNVETRSKLLRRVSSKKSKSLHQSPTMEVKAFPTASQEISSIAQRAVSVTDIPESNDTQLPLRPFHPLSDGKPATKTNRDSAGKETKTPAPLTDLLKSLRVENDLTSSAHDEIKTQVDLKSKEIPKAPLNSKDLPTGRSGETEAEYIHMR